MIAPPSAPASHGDLPAAAPIARPRIREMGGRDVFDGHAERLEQRNLRVRLAAGHASSQQVPELPRDMVRSEKALGLREDDVAGLGGGADAGIHEQPRLCDQPAAELSMTRAAGADGADVRSLGTVAGEPRASATRPS